MAHYDFYAEKKVTSIGAWINRRVTAKLAKTFTAWSGLSESTTRSVLEIGPGQGHFASLLAGQKGIAYKAYEPERILFEKLTAQGLNVVSGAVPPIHEHDESFDAVAIINVFEHLPSPAAAEELLGEIRRVLRKKGMLFIVVPNYLDWGRDFFNLDYTHQTIMTESRLSQMLQDAGFHVETIAYHYGCFFSGVGRIPNALARMCRAMLTVVLPRKLSRKDTVQKLGVLFAENIICHAEKR